MKDLDPSLDQTYYMDFGQNYYKAVYIIKWNGEGCGRRFGET